MGDDTTSTATARSRSTWLVVAALLVFVLSPALLRGTSKLNDVSCSAALPAGLERECLLEAMRQSSFVFRYSYVDQWRAKTVLKTKDVELFVGHGSGGAGGCREDAGIRVACLIPHSEPGPGIHDAALPVVRKLLHAILEKCTTQHVPIRCYRCDTLGCRDVAPE